MKKSLIITALLAGATGVYAQGTIQWADHIVNSFTVHIYQPQAGAAGSTEVIGNSSIDFPAGSTVYTGGLAGGAGTGMAGGANITVELFAAPGNVVAGGFSGLSPVTQYTSTLFTVSAGAGLFKPTAVTGDTGIPGATSQGATVAIAAWYNANGVSTYAAAVAAGAAYGHDNPFFIATLGAPPGSPPDLAGLQSFSLVTTPEPSTIALGVIGAASFLIRRRK